MSNLNVSTALELIEANEGDTITVLRARMTIEGYKPKVITEAIAEAKAAGTLDVQERSTGFVKGFYTFLKTARTEAEVLDYIHTDTSNNVKNHETHYLGVWSLTVAVREEMAAELVELAEAA